jgi:hypothetical protein
MPYPLVSPQAGETLTLGFNCAFVLVNSDIEATSNVRNRKL